LFLLSIHCLNLGLVHIYFSILGSVINYI
jgi:hypothetical protein